MGLFNTVRMGASGVSGGDYEIDRSVRFNRSDNHYLKKQPSSAGNRRTFTISLWVKRQNFGSNSALFYAGTSVGQNHNDTDAFLFSSNDYLSFVGEESQTVKYDVAPSRKFRDPSAWYHIVLAVDTTQGTASNRIKFYVNGVQETDFVTSTYPSQNYELFVNSTVSGGYTNGNTHFVGYSGGGRGLDGYIAEYHLIDGLQLTPDSFGETKATTGQWIPINTEGLTYGTNGFRLQFLDNSSTTATTLGKDTSGNSNNYTPQNFGATAVDQLTDTPTNNFCTLNSVKKDGQTTLSNGSLQASGSQTSTYNINTQGTFAQSSGKWYYEVEFASGSGSCAVGWARTTLRSSDNPTTGGGIIYRPTSGDYLDLAANNPTTPPTTSTGTVIQVAIDFDAGKIWFGSGGTYFNSGDPSAGSNEAMTFTGGSELLAPVVRTMAATFNFNFGQSAFSYTIPTGYKTLSSNNLAEPSILLPNAHFNTLLYTGNDSSSRDITGVGFQPDFVWIKNRSQADFHMLQDSIRGANKVVYSNDTDNEQTDNANGHVNSFLADGFNVDAGGSGNVNENNENYVAWNWNAGGSTVTNNDGSTSSQVRANTTAGFSIVTYTGTGSSTTIGHGLGVAPKVVLTRSRSSGGSWGTLHTDTNPNAEHRINLNDNGGHSSYQGGNIWGDTVPTSSVFTVNSDSTTNSSGGTYVAYVFSEVAGYSKFGSYTGNGSSDGTFVFTGFRPAWVMMKRVDASGNWFITDNKRDTFNEVTKDLQPNNSNAEVDNTNFLDFLSNGFKLRTTGTSVNSGTIAYYAFAESPFKYSRAR